MFPAVVAQGRSARARVAGVLLVGVLGALALLLALSRSDAAAAGIQCPTFRVLHNDRIGSALLPAGTYRVKLTRGSKLSCAAASSLFARFLEDPSGVLPGKWQMKSKRAVFFRKNQPKKRRFRVDPGT